MKDTWDCLFILDVLNQKTLSSSKEKNLETYPRMEREATVHGWERNLD
jgi:hypothetical protein